MRRAWVVLVLAAMLVIAPALAVTYNGINGLSINNILTKEPELITYQLGQLCQAVIEYPEQDQNDEYFIEPSTGVTHTQLDYSGTSVPSFNQHPFSYGSVFPSIYYQDFDGTCNHISANFGGFFFSSYYIEESPIQNAGPVIVAFGDTMYEGFNPTIDTLYHKPTLTIQPQQVRDPPTDTAIIQDSIICAKEFEAHFDRFSSQPDPATIRVEIDNRLTDEGKSSYSGVHCPLFHSIRGRTSQGDLKNIPVSEIGFQGWAAFNAGSIDTTSVPVYMLPMNCPDVRLTITNVHLTLDPAPEGQDALFDINTFVEGTYVLSDELAGIYNIVSGDQVGFYRGKDTHQDTPTFGVPNPEVEFVDCDPSDPANDCNGFTFLAKRLAPTPTNPNWALYDFSFYFKTDTPYAGGLQYAVECFSPNPHESQTVCESQFGTWLPNNPSQGTWDPEPPLGTNCCLTSSEGFVRDTTQERLTYVCTFEDDDYTWVEHLEPDENGCELECCPGEYTQSDEGGDSFTYCWDGFSGGAHSEAQDQTQLNNGDQDTIYNRYVSQTDEEIIEPENKNPAQALAADGELYFCGPQWHVPETINWAHRANTCDVITVNGQDFVCTLGNYDTDEEADLHGWTWKATPTPVYNTQQNRDLLTPTAYTPTIQEEDYEQGEYNTVWNAVLNDLQQNDAFYCEEENRITPNTEQTCSFDEGSPLAGAWFGATGPANDQRCCFETRHFGGENYVTITHAGDDFDCREENGVYSWNTFDGVRLTKCNLNEVDEEGNTIQGWKVEGDPDSYCCYQEKENIYHGAPHLVVQSDRTLNEDTTATQQTSYFCDSSQQTTVDGVNLLLFSPENGRFPESIEKTQWAYNQGANTAQGETRWDYCGGREARDQITQTEGKLHGPFICQREEIDVQGEVPFSGYEFYWTQCECDRNNQEATPGTGSVGCNGQAIASDQTHYCTATQANTPYWTTNPDDQVFCPGTQFVGNTCCRTDIYLVEQDGSTYDACYGGQILRGAENPTNEPLFQPNTATQDRTNAIVVNGKIHLCSDHWTIQTQGTNIVDEHTVCSTVAEGTTTYTCTITAEGYRWQTTTNTYTKHSAQLETELTTTHQSVLQTGAVGCVNGQLQGAETQTVCEGAGGNWRTPQGQNIGCCIEHTQGHVRTDGYVCEPNGWQEVQPQTCTHAGQTGQRFPLDPAGYCCTDRVETRNKPHLIEGNTNPYGVSQRIWACEANGQGNGELRSVGEKYPDEELPEWTYEVETQQWHQCSPNNENAIEGPNLCVQYVNFATTDYGWETCECTLENPSGCKSSEHATGYFCGVDSNENENKPRWYTDFLTAYSCGSAVERWVGPQPICCFKGVYEAFSWQEEGELNDYTQICFGFNDEPSDIVIDERTTAGLHSITLPYLHEQGSIQEAEVSVYATDPLHLVNSPAVQVCGDYWLYNDLPIAEGEDPQDIIAEHTLCQTSNDQNTHTFHCWATTEAWTMQTGEAGTKAITSEDTAWTVLQRGINGATFFGIQNTEELEAVGCLDNAFATERNQDFCLQALNGNWLTATGNFENRCCFTQSRGRTYLGATSVYACDGNQWEETAVVSCGNNGLVFQEDEGNYCCDENDFAPYGYENGVYQLNPREETEHFCNGGQIEINEENLWQGGTGQSDWAYSNGGWSSCTEGSTGVGGSEFLCQPISGFVQCSCPETGQYGCGQHQLDNQITWYCSQTLTGQPFWTQNPNDGISCSEEERIGEAVPICCHENVYAAATYTHNTEQLTEVCYDDDILQEHNSPSGTQVTLQPGTIERTVVVTEQNGKQLHVCGTTWTIPGASITHEHTLCGQVQPAQEIEPSICWVDETGQWDWKARTEVPAVIDSTHPQWNQVQPKLTTQQQGWEAFGCANGQPEEAIIKYGPPPTLQAGYCPESQCHQPDSPTGCVDVGEETQGYVCTQTTTGANWVSSLNNLAQELLKHAQGEFIINCGDESVSANKQTGISTIYGHCQLANDLNGQGEPDYIILGVAFAKQDSQAQTSFFNELNTIHEINQLEPFDITQPYAPENFYEYSYEEGYGYFTEENSLSGNLVSTLLQWIENLLGSTQTPELVGTTSDQFYITGTVSNGFTNIDVYAVEYAAQTQTGCPTRRTIVTPTETQCYQEERWRKIIQQRP